MMTTNEDARAAGTTEEPQDWRSDRERSGWCRCGKREYEASPRCEWHKARAERLTTDDEREALAPIRALVANLASRLYHVETHWTPDERSTPMSTADVLREFDRLAADFRRQGPITDAQVKVALKKWYEGIWAGGWDNAHEMRMRAALEAARDAS